ncbi:MAG: Gfo/Idh/MocA family protein [Halanaerobiaceae bacterium]
MNNKLEVAIIGCGNIYKTHADAIQKSEKAELIAVADIKEDRAREAGLEYSCDYYAEYEEMLKDDNIDVVHICTPHYLHSPMSIKSLEAGKNVLVEKPIAENVDAARKLLKKSKACDDLHLGVVFQNRYNNTSQKAKELITDGELGEIRGIKGIVTWHRNEKYYQQDPWRGKWDTEGGGVLINQSIHTLDLIQWLGGGVKAVKGSFDTRVLDDVIEVEDTAEATLYYKNGTVGLFYATNCFTTNSPIEIEIHGEKGLLKITDNDLILTKEGKTSSIQDDDTDTDYKSYWGKGHQTLIEDFYDNILKGERNYVTAEAGIKSLEIIEGIYQSAGTDHRYDLS